PVESAACRFASQFRHLAAGSQSFKLSEMKWIVASTACGAAALAALSLLLRPGPSQGPVMAHAAEPKPEDRAIAIRWVEFEGACDASGAVPVDEMHFAVADDEDNVLRVYDAVN